MDAVRAMQTVTIDWQPGVDFNIDFTHGNADVTEKLWSKRFRLSDGSTGFAFIELHHNDIP
jgi:hypothetical protein